MEELTLQLPLPKSQEPPKASSGGGHLEVKIEVRVGIGNVVPALHIYPSPCGPPLKRGWH